MGTECTLPTSVRLARWTAQGVQGVQAPPQRPAGAREGVSAAGGEIKEGSMLMGDYDLLVIWEAPDDTALAQPLLRIAGLGKVRTTTMRAFTELEMGEIVGGLSGGALVCEGGGRPGGRPLWAGAPRGLVKDWRARRAW